MLDLSKSRVLFEIKNVVIVITFVINFNITSLRLRYPQNEYGYWWYYNTELLGGLDIFCLDDGPRFVSFWSLVFLFIKFRKTLHFDSD